MPPIQACHPRAARLMSSSADALQTTSGLIRAATAIAIHARPENRPDDVERTIAGYAEAVAARIPRIANEPRPLSDRDVQIVMAHLHFVLFDQAGFTGNTAAYYDERNSYLPDVLARRLGIPISLALVYKAVGEPLGLRIHGIALPVHFVLEIETTGRPMYVDPFDGGRLLWADEVVARHAKSVGVEPESVELRRATHTEWIARLLRNLEVIFAEAGRRDDLQAMRELASLASLHG